MGRKGKSVLSKRAWPATHLLLSQADNQLVALQTDATGRVRYDALARQGQRDGKVVHSQYSDLLEKNMGEDALKKPDEDAKPISCVGGDLALVVALTVPLLILGVYGWGDLASAARDAVAIVGSR